jgi:tRNA dimethylallyltransferase
MLRYGVLTEAYFYFKRHPFATGDSLRMQAIKNMPLSEENNLMVILGPTASGKTTLAVQLAREFDGEIISADSRQVYRGMDLGTGKDLSEYHFANKPIPYHLIDIMDPREEFNLFQFQQCFAAVYKDIIERRKVPLLVGGTGMYLESIILNYQLREVPEDLTFREEMKTLDMDSLMQLYITERSGTPHNKTDMTDHHRLVRAIEISKYGHKEPDATIQAVLGKLSPFVIGVRWERSILRKRISQRLHDRLGKTGCLWSGIPLYCRSSAGPPDL